MNRADLVALVRASGRRRAPARARRMVPPDVQRLGYFKALREALLRDLRAVLDLYVVPYLKTHARQDADDPGDLSDALERARAALARKWTDRHFAELVQPVAHATASFSRAQLAGVLASQLGIDVTISEPWLAAELDRWTRRNVDLIKTLPQTFFPDLEKRLVAGIHSGERWEALAETMKQRLGVTESRANLIARDQVGKLFGQLNERRMGDLGITGYVWRTVRDNRVRDEHEDREGEHFEWSAPPHETDDDGHPGTPIQCRCYSEPDVGPILAEASKPGEVQEIQEVEKPQDLTMPPGWGEAAPVEPVETEIPKPAEPPLLLAPPIDPDPIVLPIEREQIGLIQNPAEWHALNPPTPPPVPAAPAKPEPELQKPEKTKAPIATPNFPDPGAEGGTGSPEFRAMSAKLLEATKAQAAAAKGNVVPPLMQYSENSTRMNAYAAGSYDPNRDPAAQSQGKTEVVAGLEKRIAELDAALAQLKTGADVVTYRALDSKSVIDALPKKLKAEITGWDLTNVAKGRGENLALFERLVGVTYTDPVFASTSLDAHVARGFLRGERVLVRVSVPKGMPGAFFNGDRTLTAYPGEHELLLPRGCRYQITGAKIVDGQPVLDVTVKKPAKRRASKGKGSSADD